jgi:hypothetical protein
VIAGIAGAGLGQIVFVSVVAFSYVRRRQVRPAEILEDSPDQETGLIVDTSADATYVSGLTCQTHETMPSFSETDNTMSGSQLRLSLL